MDHWNANQLADNKVEFHIGWQRFKNAQGNWQKISRLVTDAGGDFVMNNAPFSCTFPRWSHAIATFTATCRYDIWKKEDITADPYTMTIRARETAQVKGKLYDMNGTGVFDAVIYEGAYPQWNADLIYHVEHGRAPRLRKLIRYNSHPLVAHKPKFFVDTSHDTEMSSRNIPNGMTRRQHRDACKVILDSVDGDLQPVPLESDGGFYCRKDGEAQKRGIGIKEVRLWDSGEGEDQKNRVIPSNMRRREGHYTLVKRVPSQFFDDAVFPCYTDATATFYPDPHPETTSVDGTVSEDNRFSTWTTLVNGPGTSASPSGTTLTAYAYATTAPDWWQLLRAIMLFDTSALAGGIVSSAILSLYGVNKIVNSNSPTYNIFSSNPASNTNLVAGDFDTTGATEFSTDISHASFDAAGYNDWALNATGIAAIDVLGISKFSFLESSYDAPDNDPAHPGANQFAYLAQVNSADEAGTSKDPKLVVTYTEAVEGVPKMLIMGVG